MWDDSYILDITTTNVIIGANNHSKKKKNDNWFDIKKKSKLLTIYDNDIIPQHIKINV